MCGVAPQQTAIDFAYSFQMSRDVRYAIKVRRAERPAWCKKGGSFCEEF
jgi:hypothetical protein